MSPPRLWARLLERCLPAADRTSVQEELRRLHRARAELSGRRSAARWYRRQVLGFLARVPFERFRNRIPATDGIMSDLFIDLGRELRQALRSLVAQPGVTLVAILALVLGVGANALIFSIVDHVLLRPLPYPEPERLVAVWPDDALLRGEIGYFEERLSGAEGIGGYLRHDGFNAVFADGSRRVTGNLISPELLDVLGVRPVLGRAFRAQEDRPGEPAVVLLSHDFWRSQLGGREDVIGSSLILDGQSHEIVGVLPHGFAFPDREQDVLVPYEMNPDDVGAYWGYGGFRAVARLRPGVDARQLRDELRALSQRTRELNPLWTPPEDFRASADVVSLQEAMVGDLRASLSILLGAVGLVLLVACANVANLLLARGVARGREIAVRAALGASRRRLLRQQLLESLVLVGAGCAAAIALASVALDLFVSRLPAAIPRLEEIALDGRVLGVTVAIALAVGLLAAAVPALRAARVDPGAAMREGASGAGTSARRRRLSATMVVIQIAASVVLVTGAGLLTRTLGALGRVDPGFDVEGLTTVRLTLTPERYESEQARSRFFESVVERLRALPGIEAAAVSRVPFGAGPVGGMATFIEDVTLDPNSLPVLSRAQVTPGYFATMGIPLLQGRGIEAADGADAKLVAVVDATMAQRFWPGDSPLGKRIRYPWRGAPWLEVVGVVGGVVDSDLAADRSPTYYVPIRQTAPLAATVVARGVGGEPVPVATIRDIARDIDPATPISVAGPMRELVSGSLAGARWSALLLSLFAGVTLALGCIGVYGLVAYSVGERTRDIGVQMALGAPPARIRMRVLAQGLLLSLPGAAIGLLVAIPAGRILESQLFGVPPVDPVTFAAVPVLLVLATLVAVYVPARRATRVDPSSALRAEV